jgi:hypothetical protein
MITVAGVMEVYPETKVHRLIPGKESCYVILVSRKVIGEYGAEMLSQGLHVMGVHHAIVLMDEPAVNDVGIKILEII